MRFVLLAVLVGCGSPDIGDPISCPACEPGELFESHFLDTPSLTIAGTPLQVVYSRSRGAFSEANTLAWLKSDYTVRTEASTGIESKAGRTRIIREVAMADDGVVAALAEVSEELEAGFAALMVFDRDGHQRWRREIDPALDAISIGPRHIFVSFRDLRSIAIDGQVLSGPFVAALDRDDGSLVWSRAFNVKPASGARLLTVPDPSGGVIVGSAFSDTLDLGGGITLVTSASQSGFVALLDEAGVGRWAVQLDPTDDSPDNGIVAAARIERLSRGPGGEVALVASWFGGPLAFLGETYPTPPLLDGNLIALLDADGTLAWARDVGRDRTTAVLTDGEELVVSGLFLQPLSYDGTVPEEESDGFVAAVTRDGPRWVRLARGPGRQHIDVVSYTSGGSITAVIDHEYNGEGGPKPGTYGGVTLPGNGLVLGALAP